MHAELINWPELEKEYFMPVFKRPPAVMQRGKGMYLWDTEGKKYLDFVAGIAVVSLGHCHPVVAKALASQAKTLIHTSNLYYSTPQLKLAELLVKHSCLDHVFICNSGAEANEGAIKLARRYGKLKLGGAYEIITANESFHGRTLATIAATGQNKFQEPYIPMPDGFINVPYNDISAVKQATSGKTCAVMLEPIQGEGGVNVPADNYLKEVRAWCDEKGILLILDEVQTGIGRIGTLFGYQQYGVEPDIIALAKGLGGGVPIGAFLARKRASVFGKGDHGSTFGGNPLVCHVAYQVMSYIIDHDIPGHVKKAGAYLDSGLKKLAGKYEYITDIRGRGLLMAISFRDEIATDVALQCMDRGLLVNPVKPDALRFMPPLIAGEKDIDKALRILDNVLKERKPHG